MTSDLSAASRRRMYIDGADIMVSGHTHDRYAKEDVRLVLTSSGEIVRRSTWTVKTGTYKDAYGTGEAGWEVEKGHPPKPLGQWWLRFYVENRDIKISLTPAS